MKKIKEKKVDISAKKLYEIVKTNHIISKRCLNFTFLEEKALEYDNYIKKNSEKETEVKEKSESQNEKNPWTEKLKNDKNSELER